MTKTKTQTTTTMINHRPEMVQMSRMSRDDSDDALSYVSEPGQELGAAAQVASTAPNRAKSKFDTCTDLKKQREEQEQRD